MIACYFQHSKIIRGMTTTFSSLKANITKSCNCITIATNNWVAPTQFIYIQHLGFTYLYPSFGNYSLACTHSYLGYTYSSLGSSGCGLDCYNCHLSHNHSSLGYTYYSPSYYAPHLSPQHYSKGNTCLAMPTHNHSPP